MNRFAIAPSVFAWLSAICGIIGLVGIWVSGEYSTLFFTYTFDAGIIGYDPGSVEYIATIMASIALTCAFLAAILSSVAICVDSFTFGLVLSAFFSFITVALSLTAFSYYVAAYRKDVSDYGFKFSFGFACEVVAFAFALICFIVSIVGKVKSSQNPSQRSSEKHPVAMAERV